MPLAPPSRAAAVWVICGVVASSGCVHRSQVRPTDLRNELAAVTAEELFAVAISYTNSGDLLRAEQYFVASLERGYDSSSVVSWLVRVCIASSRYQSALRHSAGYLGEHPNDWSLRLVIASIHEALGDPVAAQLELERIVEARPNEPLPHFRLAMLYHGRESMDTRATQHLREYLRLEPDGPHAAAARATLSEAANGSDALPGPRRIESLGSGSDAGGKRR